MIIKKCNTDNDDDGGGDDDDDADEDDDAGDADGDEGDADDDEANAYRNNHRSRISQQNHDQAELFHDDIKNSRNQLTGFSGGSVTSDCSWAVPVGSRRRGDVKTPVACGRGLKNEKYP